MKEGLFGISRAVLVGFSLFKIPHFLHTVDPVMSMNYWKVLGPG